MTPNVSVNRLASGFISNNLCCRELPFKGVALYSWRICNIVAVLLSDPLYALAEVQLFLCCDAFCFMVKMIRVAQSCSHKRVWKGSGTDRPKIILPVLEEKPWKKREPEEIAYPLWPVVPWSDKRCFLLWTKAAPAWLHSALCTGGDL